LGIFIEGRAGHTYKELKLQVYGFLEKAQLENVTVDLSNTLLGLVWYNTTDNKMKIYDGAVRAMVTEDGAATLTNKIFSGGTIAGANFAGNDINLGVASDSNKLVVSTNTKANLDALTRESASIYYATDEDKFYGDNGTSLVPLAEVSSTTVTKTTTATLLTSGENNVVVDATIADFTVTLPTAVGNNGLAYKVTKSTLANLVTVDANGSEEIGGYLTVVLSDINDCIIFVSDGSDWVILSDDRSHSVKYTDTSGQSISHNTLTKVSFDTVKWDKRSLFSTDTTTVDANGKYTLKTRFLFESSSAWEDAESSRLFVYVNNSEVDYLNRQEVQATGSLSLQIDGSCDLDLLEGDTVDVRIVHNADSAISLSTVANANAFSLTKIN